MKVIFLDIDGVLNPERNVRKQLKNNKSISSYNIELDQECLHNLEWIVYHTHAKIVVSSNWRIGGPCNPAILNLHKQLEKINLDIFSFTPILGPKRFKLRGDEIRRWIRDSSYNIESFVILDDGGSMGPLTYTNLIRCPAEDGLTKECAIFAIDILNINDCKSFMV